MLLSNDVDLPGLEVKVVVSGLGVVIGLIVLHPVVVGQLTAVPQQQLPDQVDGDGLGGDVGGGGHPQLPQNLLLDLLPSKVLEQLPIHAGRAVGGLEGDQACGCNTVQWYQIE